MIKIEKSQLISDSSSAMLTAYISIDSNRERVWFKVDKKFEEYLCFERADPFVIAVLNYAMRNKHDIECELPISEDLYYNIDKYLIDALVSYNKNFYRPKIVASVASEPLSCAEAVGTGISCGVDSLHSLACQTGTKFKKHNITHLMFNNVGSHGEDEVASKLYSKRISLPEKFAHEYGFEFVATDSNLMNVVRQNHFKTHTYSSMFAVYCLQKLFSVYYYASAGFKYDEFTLIDKPSICPGSYEMFSLPLFSTRNLRIYSEGEGLSRLQKLKTVAEYEPSFKYLNVCLRQEVNCNICEKCVRTILDLDALGVLDRYKNVFDVDYYRKNKKWYLEYMLRQIANRKHDYYEIYHFFKHEITLGMRLKVLPYAVLMWFTFILPTEVKHSKRLNAIRRFYLSLIKKIC